MGRRLRNNGLTHECLDTLVAGGTRSRNSEDGLFQDAAALELGEGTRKCLLEVVERVGAGGPHVKSRPIDPNRAGAFALVRACHVRLANALEREACVGRADVGAQEHGNRHINSPFGLRQYVTSATDCGKFHNEACV